MKFTSDQETIIKLQTLNNTINNLEKTYQGLLKEGKNITEKQAKIVDKIEHIETLNEIIKNIGSYHELEILLREIQEISPFLKDLENQKSDIENNIKSTQNHINDYLQIDENLADKVKLFQENITKLEQDLEKIGGFEALQSLLEKAISTKKELADFSADLEQKLTEKMANELREFAEKLGQEMANKIAQKQTINLDKIADHPWEKRIKSLEKQVEYLSNQNRELQQKIANSEENNINETRQYSGNISLELTWENILKKEPLIGIIKKYAETYRIEKLYTTTTGQLVYGIKRSTIRIIIILQNMKVKSIILRDEDKRKELNLTPEESHFIYQYMDSYIQPIN
jgi:DNA repair exonuclease SbcCD ATPase subunit